MDELTLRSLVRQRGRSIFLGVYLHAFLQPYTPLFVQALTTPSIV